MGSSPKKAARKMAAQGRTTPSVNDKSNVSMLSAMDPGHKVAWVSLHLLLFAVPLAMSNWTWLGFDLPFTYDQFDIAKVFLQRGITLVAYAGLAWSLLSKGGRVRGTKVDWLILVFLGWVVLTTVLSIHPPTAVFGKYRRFEGLISFVNYAAIFFLAVQLVDRPSRIRALAKTTFLGGVLVSAYGAMQVLGIDPIKWGSLPFEANRAFSTYGNPDLLGGYIVLVLPLGLALALVEKDVWWRTAYWAGFLVVTFTWITAFVRGAWIGGVVALAVLAFAAWRHRAKLGSVDYGFMGVIALMAAMVVIRSLSAPSDVLNVVARLRSIFDFDAGSALTRFQIWQAAIDAIRDKPIFGFGADTFRLIFPKYKPVEYVAAAGYLSVADNVHNYPLQLASALGIPGFLLLYGLFGWTARLSAKTAFGRQAPAPEAAGKGSGGLEKAGETRDKLLLAAFWAGAAGYVTHLLFGLSVTGSTFMLWAFMGILLAPSARGYQFRTTPRGSYLAAGLMVPLALLFIGNVVYVTADHHYLMSRVTRQGESRVQAVKTAITLNPYNDMYQAELGLAYQDQFISYATQARAAESSGQDGSWAVQAAEMAFKDAEEAMKDTIEYVPYEYDNYVFLSNLYNVGPRLGMGVELYGKAVEVAKKGIEVEEFGPAVRLQLAVAYNGQGKRQAAIETLEAAVEMDPRYVDANMLLGQLHSEAGNIEEAKAAYERVLAVREDQAARNSLQQLEEEAANEGGEE